ncbi:MAG: hypothetical protein ACREX6_08115 [Casimicrobiaceae bacterium]
MSYLSYWGKARPRANGGPQFHLLAYHCLDVAATGRVCKFATSFQNQRPDLLEEMQARTSSKAYVGVRRSHASSAASRCCIDSTCRVIGSGCNLTISSSGNPSVRQRVRPAIFCSTASIHEVIGDRCFSTACQIGQRCTIWHRGQFADGHAAMEVRQAWQLGMGFERSAIFESTRIGNIGLVEKDMQPSGSPRSI